MGVGGVIVSPWTWEARDYQGNKISITIPFDNTTKVLSNGTIFRDAACVYTTLIVGVGGDGTVESSTKTFSVPSGTHTITASAMSSKGINTIDDILNLQITAK